MGKHRGEDGWLYDDSVGGSDKNIDHTLPESEKETDPPEPSEEDSEGMTKGEVVSCCGILTACTVLTLLGVGIGYAVGGIGGVLIGIALTLLSLGIFFGFCINYSYKADPQ